MPESDPLQILLAHDHWATTQLLIACDNLPPDAFHRRFDIGPGSLHDTITHIIGATRTWTETLAHVALLPRLESDGQRRGPADLIPLLNAAHEAFVTESRRLPLNEMATRQLRSGPTVHMTRAAILTHVTTHSMHHRAQCLNMLRQLGVTPMPLSSVAEWTMMEEGPVVPHSQ